jgi:hypothetical protein
MGRPFRAKSDRFALRKIQRASSLFNAGQIATIKLALSLPLHQCSGIT